MNNLTAKRKYRKFTVFNKSLVFKKIEENTLLFIKGDNLHKFNQTWPAGKTDSDPFHIIIFSIQ